MRRFTIVIFLFCLITNVMISRAQQQPLRVPFYKTVSESVQAKTLSGFVVTPITPAQLVSFLLGPGAVISNLTYSGSPLALGMFIDSLNSIGLDSGIVISTGDVATIPGPNLSASTSTDLGLPGDSMLTSLTVYPTYDAAIVEFDLLVNTDTLSANFILASEEYPEFISYSFNDVFAFFVSGPGITGTKNIAHLPGSSTIISINNVNHLVNSQYYIDNTAGQIIEFDGYTVPVTLFEPIQNGQLYHFKIAIADCSDRVFDTGIFIKKGSVLGYACMPVPGFDPVIISGLTVQFTNTTNYAQYYTWDYGDGTIDTTTQKTTTHTYTQAGQYQVTLKAYNYYQVATCTQLLNIGNAGVPVIDGNTDISIQNLGRGVFKLDLGNLNKTDISIFSLAGVLMQSFQAYTGKEVIIDLSGLAKGMYILRINTSGTSNSYKIIR